MRSPVPVVTDERPVARTGPGFGLALMLCAQFMVMLDASIVTVAIPDLQHGLGFSPTGVQAVITAYNTAFGGALVLCGRIGDLLGRRRIFAVGMVCFSLSSLLCGLSGSAVMLVSARALQGLSAALIAPTALALLTTAVPQGPQRVRAMSMFGMATVVGFVGGLVLSGLLVREFGWRGVFFATVPVGFVVAALTPRFVARASRLPHRVDVVGAGLITASVALLVAAPGQGVGSGWTSARCLVPLAAGVVLLGLFVVAEQHHPEPLVRLGLLRSPALRAANVVSVLSGVSSGAAYLLATMYFQDVLGYSPLKAGLIVAPVGLLNIAFGLVIGKLITRAGPRASMTTATLSAGTLILLVGSQVRTDSPLAFALVLLPMGMSFMATTITSTLAATWGVADHEQGVAAGIRQTSFQLGIAIGVAALIPIATGRVAHLAAGVSAATRAHELAGGIQVAYYVLGALVAASGVVAWTGLRPAPGPRR